MECLRPGKTSATRKLPWQKVPDIRSSSSLSERRRREGHEWIKTGGRRENTIVVLVQWNREMKENKDNRETKERNRERWSGMLLLREKHDDENPERQKERKKRKGKQKDTENTRR